MNRPAEQKSKRLGLRLLLAAGLIAGVAFPGCGKRAASNPNPPTQAAPTRPARIVAQGQILPEGGLIRLAATPGDVVDDILVAIGERVSEGKQLIVLRSSKVNEARRKALQSRLEDARQQQQNAIAQAQLRLSATEVKLEQIVAQTKALDRQQDLLKNAEKQVNAAEKVFERLSSISKDPLTRDFVGLLQLEQQQIAVGEAQLKYQQQVESFQQAKDGIEFESIAAKQEQRAAQLALEVAQSSLAVASIESELNALELQQQSSTVTAPQSAVVVAINTREGEAAGQFPLIELADDTQIICEAEVVETDAALVKPDQMVRITSPALPQTLHGKVERRGQLVGRPQLAVADPLAKADYRSVTVVIKLAPADVAIAAQWLQLQVNVEIELEPDTASPPSAAPNATTSATAQQ